MKPVVVDVNISLEQLFEEFVRLEDALHRDTVREQILVKMRRRLKRLHDQARALYLSEAGETPEATLKRLARESPAAVATWIKQKTEYRTHSRLGPGWRRADADSDFASRGRGRGRDTWIRERPKARRLSRQLHGFHKDKHQQNSRAEHRCTAAARSHARWAENAAPGTDALGYSDASLRRAWCETKNEDIAASVIGFVRQAALGDALTPFDLRVQRGDAAHPCAQAMDRSAAQMAEAHRGAAPARGGRGSRFDR